MSHQAVVNTPPTSGPDAAAATSEWFKREGYYAAQAVANAEHSHWRTIERRLGKPSRLWTRKEVVRSYRTNLDGEVRFRDEGEAFTPHGYFPWLVTDPVGNRHGGSVRIATSSGAWLNEPDARRRGNRRVSWVKDASFSEDLPKSVPTNPQGADRKRALVMPTWRKATWTLVIWTLLIIAWLAAAWATVVAIAGVFGFGLLGLVWLMSRSRFNTLIHGPNGQHWIVSAERAKRRVQHGWSYSAPATQAESE